MKNLIVILFLISSISAQYKKEFKDLIETTYLRTFDDKVVLKYLNSESEDSIKAALLTIANSNQTKFIENIINIDNDYLVEKSFALGKLGADSLSEKFLLENLNNVESDFNSQRIFFEALGNVISEENLINLLNEKSDYYSLPFTIVNSVNQKSKIDKEIINSYLLNNLESTNEDLIFSSLYALYRIFPPNGSEEYFVNLLSKKFDDREIEIKTYTLGCLRRLKRFPIDKELFTNLLADKDWKIRTELARSSVFFRNFDNIFEPFLNLIVDENPNVSRQAAISLREIKPEFISESKIIHLLKLDLPLNTFGELIISYSKLFPGKSEELIEEYKSKLARKFIFEIIDNINDAETRFDLLKKEIAGSNSFDRIYLSQSLLKLEDQFRRDDEFAKIIISLLRESNAPVISIVADGISESFVSQNSSLLQELIIDHLFTKINDANFVESIQSLYRLSKKVSPQFENQVSEIISTSKVSSIKQITSGNSIRENDLMFSKIFENSFKYSEAVILTNKGEFRFEFFNEIAPISVGNFCYLAEKKYFNGNKFHRVVPNFVIQTGDSTSTGWGGPGYDIISEFSWLPFETGYVGMASAGKDTEGSQWFVMHNYYPHLNNNYTVFGRVVKGQNTVDIIDENDVVFEVRLIQK